MKIFKPAFVSALGLVAASMASTAQADDLTLYWAAWGTANALVELSKEFEEQSSHNMSFEFIPWPNFADATVYAYPTWPKGTPNYYALPAMSDANGWFYRKDWFARDDIKAAFK